MVSMPPDGSDSKNGAPGGAAPAGEPGTQQGQVRGEGEPREVPKHHDDIIAALRVEVADLKDRVLRAHAEVENIRKRSEKEREETAKYAITRLARDIVGVGDNFQRAIDAVPPDAAERDPTLKSFLEGVTLTERELLNVLERHGIRRVEPKGEAFNPNVHQAVMEVQRTDVPSGTIVQVFQPGFVIEDRVLRPAMVVVAKGGPKPGQAGEAADDPPPTSNPANDDNPQGSGAA